jgi:hypothetical protein
MRWWPSWRVRAAAAALAVAVVCGGAQLHRSQNVRVPLLASAVVIGVDGERLALTAGDVTLVVPGTRVLGVPELAATATEQARWLRSGRVPGADGRFADMTGTALLDLHTLTLPGGAAIAGWPQAWRYVWPRDASFVAVALARTGHRGDAVAVLQYLQRMQAADGALQARYLPDGSGRPPDGRGEQTDGLGWVLWASEQVVLTAPAGERAGLAASLRPLVTRSLARILTLTSGRTVLPPPSPDYWEVRDVRLSLGTVAPLALGLRSAPSLLALLGLPDADVVARAAALELALHRAFAPGRYPRYLDDAAPDASLAFLLPPFTEHCRPDVHDAWRGARDAMRRPAGGLAPGAGWKNDGISWTPETALFALTAAATGDRAAAEQYLTWLDRHRTGHGALPEKVLSNGDPAGPAPLSWTAALVVLTVDALDQQAPARCAPAG